MKPVILGFQQKPKAPLIRPLLSVNSGPTPFANIESYKDLTSEYQSVGVEAIRSIDYMTGANDVMCFFPDKDADAQQNKNYDWQETDRVFKSIIDGGFRPELRLGMGWRNMASWGAYGNELTGFNSGCQFWKGRQSLSQTMLKSGASIFEKLLSNLSNKKKWGANHLDNALIEIWNEPNIIGINTATKIPLQCTSSEDCDYSSKYPNYMWDGNPKQFYKFFAKTAKHLKDKFPTIQIGGPAIHNVGLGITDGGEIINPGETNVSYKSSQENKYKNKIGLQWTKDFLDYMREKDVQLDFFSWHAYESDPDMIIAMHNKADQLLRSYGFDDTQQYLSEFNTSFANGNVSTALGAAQSSAIWIEMQKRGPKISQASYSRGNDGPFVPGGEGFPLQINPDGSFLAPMDFGNYGVGLFQTNGAPKPAAHAFSFWSQLANREIIPIEKYLQENPSSQPSKSVYSLGGIKKGTNGQDISIILANTSSIPEEGAKEQSPIFNIKKFIKNHKLDRNSLQIQSVQSDDGLLNNEDNNKNQVTIDPGTTIYLQANTTISDDPITVFADGSTKEVGQMIAGQNNLQWGIVGGENENLFTIDADSGMLEFVDTPANSQPDLVELSNPIYTVIVSAQGINGESEQRVNVEIA